MNLPVDQYSPFAPLRLNIAASIAFPDGSMTASGLRREASKGRLIIEMIAGKQYVSLSAIEEMRTQCRVENSHQDSGSDRREGPRGEKHDRDPFGSSSTAASTSPQDALRAKIKQRSKPCHPTLQRNTNPRTTPLDSRTRFPGPTRGIR